MTMSEISDELVDWVGPIEIPALTAKKILSNVSPVESETK